ncbi:MAG: transcriptional repressor [Candidatus Krumholzibacteria bacterium]|nr:transcriptional repressor [Candidatus Krumholzibacteria bacterium]
MAITKLRRNTPQRRVILEELCLLKSHPTAAELYAIVRKRLPRISLGTVYRNLEVLHEDGVIDKMEFAGAESRFDGNTELHYHVRCTECGRIEDIFPLDWEQTPAQPAELAGFQVTGYRLEYFGICPDCRIRLAH